MFPLAGTENGQRTLLEQEVISAWHDLRGYRTVPERIEVVKETDQETSVFRLLGAWEARQAIIAKRCRRSTALVESTIYEKILPHLPLPVLDYYGCVGKNSDSEFCWLFLEDANSERYNPRITGHRIAAGRWMGVMNTSAREIEAASSLPERGAEYYRRLLQTGRDTIRLNQANPALSDDDLAVLEEIVAHGIRLEEDWNPLAELCNGMPQTLVHGDFITKNVGVRASRDKIVILPFDWEKAGWGIPAEDISRVNISTYWSTVRHLWPGLSREFLKRVADVGRIFRCLVFVNWLAPSLAGDSVEQPMTDMSRCEKWLADLVGAAPWSG